MIEIGPGSPILALSGSVPALDRERCRAVVRFLARAQRAAGGTGGLLETPAAAPAQAIAALLALAAAGRLSFADPAAGGAQENGVSPAASEVAVLYTPSRVATLGLLGAAAAGSGFPEAVRNKQAAALRVVQGALLRFPPEQGGAPIEVFITDWSPCHAAAAVAVHPDHPWAAGSGRTGAAAFLGRYVRHPLTGDLLPVWAAGWVRPDFGTGAVLVNPAHDPVDLAFGRAVGLPIRFGLAPPDFDGSPAGWLAPPLVKSGVVIRGGRHDGLPASAAMAAYFEVLAGRGLAERFQDVQAGRTWLGRLIADPGGDLGWDAARRRLARDGGSGGPGGAAQRVRFEAGELLAAALAAAPGEPPVLVCPAAEQAGALLFLRLLAADVHGTPLRAAALVLVQKVQEGSLAASPQAAELSLLAGAPLSQVLVLKQQVTEQVQRFLRVHGELAALAAASREPGHGDGEEVGREPAAPLLARAWEAMAAADPARAFEHLRQHQKLLAARAAPPAALAAYFAAAAVLAGLPDVPLYRTVSTRTFGHK
jgi:leucyl-tRNA synthetase